MKKNRSIKFLLMFTLTLIMSSGFQKLFAYCVSNLNNSFNYITSVEFADLSNTSDYTSGSTAPVNYTSMIANVNANTTEDIHISVYESSLYTSVYVYIDWNQNGILNDPGEAYIIAENSITSTSFSQSISIPSYADTGNTRMRVMTQRAYTINNPCVDTSLTLYGEAEDYTIHVTGLPVCGGQPNVGTITGNDSTCSNSLTMLALNGYSANSNITYTWQSKAGSATTWTTIASSNSTILYDTVTSNSQFRCIAKCNSSNLSDTSDVFSVYLKPFTECYCTPTSISTASFFPIHSLTTTGGISNISGTTSITNPNYYNNKYSDTNFVSQYAGDSFHVNYIKGQWYIPAILHTWVDWNHNGLFEDSELSFQIQSVNDSAFSFPITIPTSADTGFTAMRIVFADSISGGLQNACQYSLYGNSIDYAVYVKKCSSSFLSINNSLNANTVTSSLNGNISSLTSIHWDFGDNSALDTGATATHTYSTDGVFTIKAYIISECGNDTLTSSVTIHTTGVNNVNTDPNSLKLYPNPTHDVLNIESTVGKINTVTITNAIGQTILTKKLNAEKYTLTLDKSLSNGLYFITLETDKGIINRKFEYLK